MNEVVTIFTSSLVHGNPTIFPFESTDATEEKFPFRSRNFFLALRVLSRRVMKLARH